MQRTLAVVALALAAWFVPGKASAAITCRIDNATDLNFGTLTLPVGAAATTMTVTASCNGSANGDVGDTVLVCAGVNNGGTPREMDRTATPVRVLSPTSGPT